jgi:hypothetical protein
LNTIAKPINGLIIERGVAIKINCWSVLGGNMFLASTSSTTVRVSVGLKYAGAVR